jgi:uncharacterized membrane protein
MRLEAKAKSHSFLKNQLAAFKTSLLVLAPLAFAAYIIIQGAKVLMAFGAFFVSSRWLALLIGLVFLYVPGFILKSRWLTIKLLSAAKKCEKRYPRLSIVLRFIAGGDEKEVFQLTSYPEVEFEVLPDIWVLGNVVKRWREGGRLWCSVYCATIPLPLTGYFVRRIPEEKLRYTGRTAQESFLTYLSFGMR